MFKSTTIFGKLFFTFIGIILISFLLFTTISYIIFKKDIEERHTKTINEHVDNVINVMDKANKEGWSQEMKKSTFDLIGSGSGQNITYYFYSKSGQLLYEAGKKFSGFTVEKKIVSKALAGQDERKTFKMPHNKRAFLVALPIENSSSEKAIIFVVSNVDQDFHNGSLLFLIAALATILVVAVMIFIISKRITTPLKNMSMVARSIAEGDFEQRVKVKTTDEIGELAETFNFMAGELAGVETMRRDFVANISHDLRTPLTSLHGFLIALLDGTIPKEQEQYYIKIMKEQTERQIRLVADLLDLARMEAKQLEIYPRQFNLSEEVRKMIGRMDPELTKRKVEIQFISDETSDIHVFADRDQINRVVINLIQNAIQFSLKKSIIEVFLVTQDEDDSAIFTVKDYGPGIKKDNLKYIWQRFYKEDEARTMQVGTGIGLSIVKQILELHHTTIHVESEEGKGTTFWFKLPLNKAKTFI
jgi:signal transduction histidine kinase